MKKKRSKVEILRSLSAIAEQRKEVKPVIFVSAYLVTLIVTLVFMVVLFWYHFGG